MKEGSNVFFQIKEEVNEGVSFFLKLLWKKAIVCFLIRRGEK
jgi:hypothetical protein